LQKFDIVTLFLGVYLGIQKFRTRNPVYQEVDSCIKKNALKLTYEHLEHQKKFPGALPPGPPGKGRQGKGGEGKGREGKGREQNGIEGCALQGKILRTPLVVTRQMSHATANNQSLRQSYRVLFLKRLAL
jgi:hypothetical protein